MTKNTMDRIEKQILLRAPRGRVWRALTNAQEFGTWFRVKFDGAFVVGKRITGQVTHPGYEHVKFEALIERMDAERFFSYRWHPYAVDPKVDYSKEPMTLLEFTLDEVPEGTKLSIVESGFEGVPLARRDEAFRMNSNGWQGQLENIRRHVAG
jgi:uncharacterized protein YndB with AHSA1/START domain